MKKLSLLAVGLCSILLLSACTGPGQAPEGQNNNSTVPTQFEGDNSGQAGDLSADSEETASTNPEDYNWTIYVQDSSTIAFGPMQMDFTIDLQAVNTSGQIYGQYIGSATTKAVSHMEGGGGSINAPVEGQSTSLVINVNPAVEEDEKLAPLTPDEPDDGKLASLVTNDDDKLASLTDQNDKLDYEGSGTMVLQSGGTGTVTARGVSVSRGIGNTSTNQLEVFIKDTTVRLAVTIPEIGTVYFDGFIRGEGKK